MEVVGDAKKSLMKREESTGLTTVLSGNPTGWKRATFVILKNHASASVTKERLSPAHKAGKEASRNKARKQKSGISDTRQTPMPAP